MTIFIAYTVVLNAEYYKIVGNIKRFNIYLYLIQICFFVNIATFKNFQNETVATVTGNLLLH